MGIPTMFLQHKQHGNHQNAVVKRFASTSATLELDRRIVILQ